MKLSPEQKAGLYITAIIHLAVIVVLLAVQIGFQVRKENTFVLDFSKQEEKERIEKQEELKISAAEKLERMLAAAAMYQRGVEIRNVAVNRSNSQLKDDRNTDAEQLYKDAERLAQDLRDGQNRRDDPEDFASTGKSDPQPDKPVKKQAYSGPSVLSWSLDGRRASHLPIPAYRCMGSGQVTVIIAVNNQGQVVNAKIEESVSTPDGCLRNFAIRAARLSRFSSSTTAPSRQMGTITYAFIAQ